MGPCVQVVFPASAYYRRKELHYYFQNSNLKKTDGKVTVYYEDHVPGWSNVCYADKDKVHFDRSILYSDGHKISFPESCPIMKGNVYVKGSAWNVFEFQNYCIMLSKNSEKEFQYAFYGDIQCIDGKANVPSDKLFPASKDGECHAW